VLEYAILDPDVPFDVRVNVWPGSGMNVSAPERRTL
jgi:hypothetical protein